MLVRTSPFAGNHYDAEGLNTATDKRSPRSLRRFQRMERYY